MLKELWARIFGGTFEEGATFAAGLSEESIETCIRHAKCYGQCRDFERGMEWHLRHRRKFAKEYQRRES